MEESVSQKPNWRRFEKIIANFRANKREFFSEIYLKVLKCFCFRGHRFFSDSDTRVIKGFFFIDPDIGNPYKKRKYVHFPNPCTAIPLSY